MAKALLVLLLLILVLAVLLAPPRQTGIVATASPVGIAGEATLIVSDTKDTFSLDLLRQLDNTAPTLEVLAFLAAWQRAEGNSGAFNPLNVSQDMPGATVFNSHGVRNYRSHADGVKATVITLSYDYPGYAQIVDGLVHNDVELALHGLSISPWGTQADLVARIIPEEVDRLNNTAAFNDQIVTQPDTEPQPATDSNITCGFTNSMEMQDGFWAGGPNNPVAAWAGQWGGYHLGNDYTGTYGDPVSQGPWWMTVTAVGSYATGDYRAGANVVGEYDNGVLFYAGHLIDTSVVAGQRIEPCTTVGHMGATSFVHTHIKLEMPPLGGSPCEGREPEKPSGCIDPYVYWEQNK